MRPTYEPGYLKHGTFIAGPRPRTCKFCGAPGQSFDPIYICPAEACQSRKAARAKAARKRYDARRRAS